LRIRALTIARNVMLVKGDDIHLRGLESHGKNEISEEFNELESMIVEAQKPLNVVDA